MKNESYPEIIISIIVAVLLVCLLNPFSFWMPTNVHMTMIVLLMIAIILFSALVWKEKTKDEREMVHRNNAGRMAYVAGTLVLSVGVIVQSMSHTLDPWLVLGLGIMVIVKLIGLLYSRIIN